VNLVEDHKTKTKEVKEVIGWMEEGVRKSSPEDFRGRRLTDEEVLQLMGCLFLKK
jgi:hypothetical protein